MSRFISLNPLNVLQTLEIIKTKHFYTWVIIVYSNICHFDLSQFLKDSPQSGKCGFGLRLRKKASYDESGSEYGIIKDEEDIM